MSTTTMRKIGRSGERRIVVGTPRLPRRNVGQDVRASKSVMPPKYGGG
jgi:hypothetical protein